MTTAGHSTSDSTLSEWQRLLFDVPKELELASATSANLVPRSHIGPTMTEGDGQVQQLFALTRAAGQTEIHTVATLTLGYTPELGGLTYCDVMMADGNRYELLAQSLDEMLRQRSTAVGCRHWAISTVDATLSSDLVRIGYAKPEDQGTYHFRSS